MQQDKLHSLSPVLHAGMIIFAVILAYAFNAWEPLSYFIPQAFAGAIILYFVLKRIGRSKLWHIAPRTMSVEMAIATFSFLILIGSTGNFESLFYPLTYIHLFFLVFSAHPGTAIATSFSLMLYHFALEDTLAVPEVAHLLTLPLILIFFLFTKQQYNDLLEREKVLEDEDRHLRLQNHSVVAFIEETLLPRMESLKEKVASAQTTQAVEAIDDIEEEVSTIEHHLDGYLHQYQQDEQPPA